MQTKQGSITKLDKLKDASHSVDRFGRSLQIGNKAIAVMCQSLDHRYGGLFGAVYLYWLIPIGRNDHQETLLAMVVFVVANTVPRTQRVPNDTHDRESNKDTNETFCAKRT